MVEDEHSDLRLLSLLHALCDKEEFIRESYRLIEGSNMNDASWCRVWNLGRDVAPDHPLFEFGKSLDQARSEVAVFLQDSNLRAAFNRRTADRRAAQRRVTSDRRAEERRPIDLPWVGEERRRC